MAIIEALPSDVLGYIFEQLYGLNRRAGVQAFCEKDGLLNDANFYWYSCNLDDPALFPCSIANVSLHWRSLAARYSRFWTRFAIDLSSPHFLLDAASWSQNREFTAMIFDSRLGTCVYSIPSAEEEALCVQRVFDALKPHLKRCISLSFDVFHSSSIPVLPTIVEYVSPDCACLNLESRFSGGRSITPFLKAVENTGISSLSRLNCLSMDVETLLNMECAYPSWIVDLGIKGFMSFKFSNYEFCYRKTAGRYTTKEFFAFLQDLSINDVQIGALDFDNLSIRPPFDRTHYPRQASLLNGDLAEIKCKNICTEFMFALCSYFTILTDEGVFERCGIPINIGSLRIASLNLVDLGPNEDVVSVLKDSFMGGILEVTGCPSFNDDALYFLTQFHKDRHGNKIYFVEEMDSIWLRRCQSISTAALKGLVEGRDVRHLRVWGAPLSSDDVEWFKARVISFEGSMITSESQ